MYLYQNNRFEDISPEEFRTALVTAFDQSFGTSFMPVGCIQFKRQDCPINEIKYHVWLDDPTMPAVVWIGNIHYVDGDTPNVVLTVRIDYPDKSFDERKRGFNRFDLLKEIVGEMVRPIRDFFPNPEPHNQRRREPMLHRVPYKEAKIRLDR